MTRYSFEIVRRGFDRFSWVFVEVCDGRRRVIARADRDFGRRKRARKAVVALQAVVADAEIIDDTGDDGGFDLPATNFQIAPYAVPLVVGSPPIERAATGGRRRRSRDRSGSGIDGVVRRASGDGALADVSAEDAGAAPPADAAVAAPGPAADHAGASRTARNRSVKRVARGAATPPARARR